jgi:hypothetical protein
LFSFFVKALLSLIIQLCQSFFFARLFLGQLL